MIFIAGGTGFIGGHLINTLRSEGYKLKCLVRSDKAQKSLESKGIEVISGDITIPETLEGVLTSEDFVIHLVGIIQEKGSATFHSIHVKGTENLVREAKKVNVKHFFYQSALGADINSWSGYLRTKAEAEEIVKGSGLSYTIFRPSLIIGPWDGFTKRLVDMLKISPVIPIPGEGKTKFQPIYIKDWLACFKNIISNPSAFISTYELGGPEHLTYREIIEALADAMDIKKPVFNIPMGLMRFGASIIEKMLPSPPFTSEQLRLLEQDNICDINSVEKNFSFKPLAYKKAIREFIEGGK